MVSESPGAASEDPPASGKPTASEGNVGDAGGGGTLPARADGGGVAGGGARIHDIGYRGYVGPRLGRAYARKALAVHSLRGAYGLGRSGRAKILPFGLLGTVFFPALALVVVAVQLGLDELPLDYTEYAIELQPVVVIFLALAAPQLVSLDLRYRITPLYFSRPLERFDYVLAKVAALSAAVFLFIAGPLLLLAVGALLGELDPVPQLTGLVKGLVGAAVFAVLHAALALLVASLTPRRGFGVAAIIAVFILPQFAVIALQGIVAAGSGDQGVVEIGLLSPSTLVDGFQMAFLDASGTFPGGAEPGLGAGAVYLLVIVALTVLSTWLMLRRYRKAGI